MAQSHINAESDMLVVLFLCLFLRYLNDTCKNVPMSSNTGDVVARSDIVFEKRELSDIITTCLATIFACTWTAIHPNIPSPVDSKWELLTRRVTTSMCALIAPELITVWALRQYVAAKKITLDYNKNIVDCGHSKC